MGSRGTETDGQPTADSTPEDVAVLYSWANIQGAKYRDYSASRREYRAQVRYRAAKGLLERELKAQVEEEAAAAEAERIALAAQAMARSSDAESILSSGGAARAARQAAAERVEAARRAESVARTAVLALREEREIAEAHASAKRQAQIYEESEWRRRQLAGPQPHGALDDRFKALGDTQGDLRGDGPSNLQQFLFSGWQDSRTQEVVRSEVSPELDWAQTKVSPQLEDEGLEDEPNAPAWLFSSQSPPRVQTIQTISQTFRGDSAGGDTLQDSRERVAARWFALKDVFDRAPPELSPMQSLRPRGEQRQLLAAFSLSGGVGKTSLVATLGRALSSEGEKIVVADTTSHGLLPIYFGSGERRAKAELEGKNEPPVSLVVYDFAERAEDVRQQEMLTEEIIRSGEGNQRLLIDLATGSSWLLRRLVDLHPTVVIPMAPDMNSVVSLQATERLFRGLLDAEGRALLPFYLLNHFDASLPLHLDVREVFRRQLGDRLLRYAVRRSPAVSEALAEGMTVLDYAPNAPVSQDYRDLATWLRNVSLPAVEDYRGMRWGER